MRLILSLTLCLCLASCSNLRQDTINEFKILYEEILSFDENKIDNTLNNRSKAFLQEFTNIKDLELDSILSLGRKYKIDAFLFQYLVDYRGELMKNNTNKAFYTYLGLEKIPPFSLSEIYAVDEKATKVNPEVFIALNRIVAGKAYVSWIRLTPEQEALKIDLIYTLQLANNRIKKTHQSALKNSSFDTIEAFYKNWLAYSDANEFDTAEIEKKIQARNNSINSTN